MPFFKIVLFQAPFKLLQEFLFWEMQYFGSLHGYPIGWVATAMSIGLKKRQQVR
jgi:hypothetical protein